MDGSSQEQPVDKSDFIQAAENNMTEGVIEHLEETDLPEEMLGVLVYKVVGEYAKSYKKNATSLRREYGFEKDEVNEMVDKASSRVLNKFLED